MKQPVKDRFSPSSFPASIIRLLINISAKISVAFDQRPAYIKNKLRLIEETLELAEWSGEHSMWERFA